MNASDQNLKDQKEDQKEPNSNLNDLLKKGTPERNELPAEEFITPDPTRSVPDKSVDQEEDDKMGISQKAKNQPSDERDASKGKK